MGVTELILFIVILIFSVVLHEVSHGAMANALGDPTAKAAGRLTLNPIPHIDIVGSIIVPGSLLLLSAITGGGILFGWAKPVPYNPFNFNKFRKWGSALVAAVGPATNIVIATIAGLSLRYLNNNPELVEGGMMGVVAALAIMTVLNIVLAVFNMLPIPPLDGSKVFFSFFNVSPQTQMFMEQNGFIFLLLFIFLGFPLIIPIINGIFTLITGMPMGGFM